MKKIILLSFAIFIFLFSTPWIVTTTAQTNPEPLSITDVENLIDKKISNEKPLTNEELNKVILELKDEKIANLEGNISKIINTAALFVGAVALVLALITGIVGWVLNISINKKLTKVSEVEASIKDLKTQIETRKGDIDETYKKINKYAEDLVESNKKLAKSSSLLEQSSDRIAGLVDYMNTIEDVTDSSVLIHKFLVSHNHALAIIHGTRKILKKPQKYPDYVLMKIIEKHGLSNEFDDYEGLIEYIEYLITCLNREENIFWEKVLNIKKIGKEFDPTDEDTMLIYEDLYSTYLDWKGYLESIEAIKDFWESQLALNPIENEVN